MPFSFALLAVLAAPVAEKPAVLEPSTRWTIDYAESQCFLARTFGTGSDRVTFGFGLLPGAVTEEIFLMEPGRDFGGFREVRGEFDLGPGTQRIESDGISARMKDGGRITRLTASADRVAAFPTDGVIAIRVDGRNYRIRLSGTRAAFGAAHACKINLMESWQLDPKLYTEVAIPAEPVSAESWLRPSDYPLKAAFTGEGGISVFRLDIDSAGVITGCTLVKSSGSDSLDRTSCEKARSRARFKPARNREGVAVPSILIQRVRWHIR